MKNTFYAFIFKLLAFVLCIVCLLAAFGGTAALIVMGENGSLYLPAQTVRDNTLGQLLSSQVDDVLLYALYDPDGAKDYYTYSNLLYTVSLNDYLLDTNDLDAYATGAELEQYRVTELPFTVSWQTPGIQKLLEDTQADVRSLNEITATVQLSLRDPMPYSDSFRTVDTGIRLLCAVRPYFGWIIGGGLLLGILLLVYLFHAAGRRPRTEGITPNALDRLPTDLYLALAVGIGIGATALLVWSVDSLTFSANLALGWLIPAGLAVLMLASLALGVLLGIAVRIKLKTLFKNTLVWRILCLLGRGLCACGRGICRLVRAIPTMWRTAAALALVLLVDFIITLIMVSLLGNEGFELLYWLIRSSLFVAAVIIATANLKAIRQGCRALAEGKLDHRVDTARLLGDYKAAGEDVNSIGKGMAKAVEERLKSERMKTELITNVSHDIKTPLTSIINYVDLLKKESLENETARGHIDVIDRQSARLKKLLEDLIEASKASTGALSISPEPCELDVMLQQAAGEYAEKLAAAGLTPVVEHPQQPVYIMADGRHLARVFDNLLGNACKYGQTGTRLYLTLKEAGGKAVVTFRNISHDALRVNGDELMERFVRGDRSRHTEGSGLGLSIARSLVELQGGTMKLLVDGDLFKVTLIFPTISAAAAAEAMVEIPPEDPAEAMLPVESAAVPTAATEA